MDYANMLKYQNGFQNTTHQAVSINITPKLIIHCQAVNSRRSTRPV